MDGASVFWNIVKVTLLLVALVIFVPMFMRRAVRPVGGGGQRLRVLESISCGGNRLICMVRCDERDMVIGVTDSQITVLSVDDAAGDTTEPAVSPPAGASFIEQFKRMVGRGGGESTP